MSLFRDLARAGVLLLPDEELDRLASLDGVVLRYRPDAECEALESAVVLALSESAAWSARLAQLRPPSDPPATR